MSDFRPHISSFGRTTKAPISYCPPSLEEFHHADGSREPGRYDPNDVHERLLSLQSRCLELGFSSIFEAALADAREQFQPRPRDLTATKAMRRFAEAGGFTELCSLFAEGCGEGKFEKLVGCNPFQAGEEDKFALRYEKLLMSEWKSVCKMDVLRRSVGNMGKESLAEFDLQHIQNKMKETAPTLVHLFERFCDNPRNSLSDDVSHKSSVRVVVALAQLANSRNNLNSFIQTIIGLYLYGSKVPKRVISILSDLGVSVCHKTILNKVKDAADEAKAALRKVAPSGNAFQFAFDNVNFLRSVRENRILNQSSMASLTAGLLVIPPASRTQKMFTKGDIHLDKIVDLRPMDFLPLETDRPNMLSAMKCMITEVFLKYIKLSDTQRNRLRAKFKMPVIYQIDHRETPIIRTFPVYNKNEAKVPEVKEILGLIGEDLGISPKQCEENLFLAKGDLLTVRNIRLAKFRQHPDHPDKDLSCFEAAPGFFHLEIAATELVFATHLGNPGDGAMLTTWIEELHKDVNKLWIKGNKIVKDFRSCLDFVDIVLDGYILAALITALFTTDERPTVDSLQDGLPGVFAEERIDKAIQGLAMIFSRFDVIDKSHRKMPYAERDIVNENAILFIQHALTLRNFSTAVSHGDIGRALVSLSYFTIWFQASNKRLYATETLRLTACIRKVWSPDLTKFFMENCLVNISGKKGAFMPDDKLNEFIVGQVKATEYAHASSEATDFQHDVRALLTMQFLELKETLAEQLGVYISDFHKTEVDKGPDVKILANRILQMGVFTAVQGRGVRTQETEVVDLWTAGNSKLGETEGIESMRTQWYEETVYSYEHLLCSYAMGYKGYDVDEDAEEVGQSVYQDVGEERY